MADATKGWHGEKVRLTAELEALKRSVAEIGAIGRNINQIARAVNQQQWPEGPSPHHLLQMIRVLTATRDHIKSLINANSKSERSTLSSIVTTCGAFFVSTFF